MPDNLLGKFAKKTFNQKKKAPRHKSVYGKHVEGIADIAEYAHQFIPTHRKTENYSNFYIGPDRKAIGSNTVTNDQSSWVEPVDALTTKMDQIDYPGGFVDIHNHPGNIGVLRSFGDRFNSNRLIQSNPDQHYGSLVYNKDGNLYSFIPTKNTPEHWNTPDLETYRGKAGPRMIGYSFPEWDKGYHNIPIRPRPSISDISTEQDSQFAPRPEGNQRNIFTSMMPRPRQTFPTGGGRYTRKWTPGSGAVPLPKAMPGNLFSTGSPKTKVGPTKFP